MGIFSIVKHQKKKWSKNSNPSLESLNFDSSEEETNNYCSGIKNIDLPNGVVLKNKVNNDGKSKKSGKNHKFIPKFFSAIFKRKYKEAILLTQSKSGKKCNGSCKSCNCNCCSCHCNKIQTASCCCNCLCKRNTHGQGNKKTISTSQDVLKRLEKLGNKLCDEDDSENTFKHNEKITTFSNTTTHITYDLDADTKSNTASTNSVFVHFKNSDSNSTSTTATSSHLNSDLNDSEKTVQRNNIQYLNYIGNDGKNMDDTDFNISECESTVGTMVSDSATLDNFSNSFLRQSITLRKRHADTLPVLDDYLAEIIRTRLPKLLQEATNWNLMYSMDQHGASLSTMYKSIKDCGPCVMVVKNSENELFGAFLSEPFDLAERGFYGTPECFLWKKTKFEFRKYNATNVNEYFILADSSFIAMGGGNGNFGFYLDDDIQFGYSSKCDTFDNDILTNENEFECYGLEIWNLEF